MVALRNRFHSVLSEGREEYWFDDAGQITVYHQREQLDKAKAGLREEGKSITLGRVVVALTFRFWKAMLNKQHENLWQSVYMDGCVSADPWTTHSYFSADIDFGTKKMATPIPPLKKSVYSDVSDDSYRSTFDELSSRLAAENNWFARKKLLLNTLKALEIVIQYENLTARKASEKVEEDPRAEFLKVVPYFIGGVLEKLAEPEISSVEQAAFYVLSAHPEHQEASEHWVEADPKHMKAFRKFLKSNRYYKNLMDDGAKKYSDFLTA